jgi:hypothetical protein
MFSTAPVIAKITKPILMCVSYPQVHFFFCSLFCMQATRWQRDSQAIKITGYSGPQKAQHFALTERRQRLLFWILHTYLRRLTALKN